MANYAVIIMAQGLNTRWLEGDPDSHGLPLSKHLLPICGVPNLSRTVRMLRDRVMVIGWPEYSDIVGHERLVTLADPGMLADGILQTRALWGTRRTTFLLGDVIWSRASLAKVLWPRSPWRILVRESQINPSGRSSSERYSLSIETQIYSKIEGFLDSVRDIGRLLDIRQWLPNEFPSERSARVARIANSNMILECEDWTDDIDTVSEWFRFGPVLQASAKREAALRGT